MPETYDFSQDTQPSELDAHMAQVHKYLQNVDKKSFRTVNPNQPAFSDTSEMLRQTQLKQGYVPGTVAARHEQMGQGGSFNTPLTPGEEQQFQQWKQQYAPKDSGADYDLRGAFKAGLKPDPQTGHWADTFKKPNHPTFSTQSQYAAYGNPGTWQGETYIPGNKQVAPTSYDFGKSEATPQAMDFGAPEVNQGPSSSTAKPFHPGQILDFLMNPMDPQLRGDIEKATGRSQLEFLQPRTWTDENIVKSLIGGTADALSTPMSYLLSPFVGKGVTAAKGLIPPIIPKPITQTELDNLVAHRSLAASAIETGAFPDPSLIPLRRQPTGNTLVVPDLNIPQLRNTGNLGTPPVETAAPGTGAWDYQRGQYSANQDLIPKAKMTPATQGPEDQLSLLGGYPAEGTESYLTHKYPLAQGEQVPLGMSELRPQVQLKQGQTIEQQQGYNKVIAGALKSRLLTPEMERTLASPPELRAAQPLNMQYSTSGKSVSVELADQGVKIPNDLTVGNTLNGAAYPNLYARTSGSIIDAARAAGPVGDNIATMADAAYSIRAMRTSQQALEATKAIDQVFGRTTIGQRIKVRAKMFSEGENAALTGERTIWGVTPAQEEEAFNHLYTNGRMPTTDPKAQGLADAVYNKLGYPASADPDVRALKGVLNPFTGKYTPFGEPGKFMPQQPIHPITVDAIKDSQWRILYERKGGEKLGISLETFKSTIVKLSQHNPEVTAAKAQGLENMRLLDLEALGGSPYQWAKKLGYETDVFRAMFRYHSLATLRGQLGRIEGPINELLMSIPAKDAAIAEWLSKAASHILQKPSAAFDTTTRMTNGIKGASHLMDSTLLQKGMLANVAQAAYIGARGGLRATGKGMLDLLTAKDRALIEQSGANFPALMNELTTPTGPMARWSSIAYRLYGLSMIDRNTRYFAGHVGNRFIQQIEGNLLKNPNSTRLQGLVKELGGDPKVLLEQGKIPDDMRLQMIQRFANYTSGVTDVRGLPLWTSSQNPWFKLVNKYRSFAASNSGEIRRAIFNAPTAYDGTKRAVTLLLGAYGLGSGIKIVGTDLINQIMGNEPEQSRAGLWNKIEPLIYGLGTVEGMLVVNAAQDPTRAALSLIGGPLAGVAVNFADDLKATAEHGIGWRSLRTVSRLLPVVGPLTGAYVKGQAKRQNASEAADRQQLAP